MPWTISDKTVVITGANSGIGFETARALGKQGARVVLVCRNRNKGEEAKRELVASTGNPNFDLVCGDLALMTGVRKVADELNAKYPAIHVLINNAGVYLADRTLTAEGLETVFAVNHLAPFLLTQLLWPKLTSSAPARVINLTSVGHRLGKWDWDNLQGEKKYTAINSYGIAKLANILFTYEMARRALGTGVTVNCVHPGPVNSNFAQDGGGWLGPVIKMASLFILSPAKGADTSVYLATSDAVAGVSGKYFTKRKPAKTVKISYDEAVAKRLWDESCRLVGLPV